MLVAWQLSVIQETNQTGSSWCTHVKAAKCQPETDKEREDTECSKEMIPRLSTMCNFHVLCGITGYSQFRRLGLSQVPTVLSFFVSFSLMLGYIGTSRQLLAIIMYNISQIFVCVCNGMRMCSTELYCINCSLM